MPSRNQTLIAVGYIRMSSDIQQDSPARQRAEIERCALREGYEIIAWYEDHGLTGTESKKRVGLKRLLKDATSGQFTFVIVAELSRLSREELFDALGHYKALWEAGVTIVDCQRGAIDFSDLAGFIQLVVGQWGAREESVRISERSVSGKLNLLRQGQRIGGSRLFGFDREYLNEEGEVAKRVHFSQSFSKPPAWRCRIVPSEDIAAVEAVRWAFRAFRDGKVTMTEISSEYNRRGLRTTRGKRFDVTGIRVMLSNPSYCGDMRALHGCQGKFNRMDQQHDGEFFLADSHEGIISRQLFQEVQSVLPISKGTRPFQFATYRLRGLVFCGHCCSQMRCAGGGSRDDNDSYVCRKHRDGSNADCPGLCIVAQNVEAAVLRIVGHRVLTDENLSLLMKVARDTNDEPRTPTQEETRLAQLRDNIKRVKHNLALAESDQQFRDVSDILGQLRQEERRLAKRVVPAKRPKSEFVMNLETLAENRENLHLADPGQLAVALRSVIDRITVMRKPNDELIGTVYFREDGLPGAEPETLTPGDLQRRVYWPMVEYVRDQGRAVNADELLRVFKITKDTAKWRMYRAERMGHVTRVGPCCWAQIAD